MKVRHVLRPQVVPARRHPIRAKLRKCLTYGDNWCDFVTPDQRDADAAQREPANVL